MKHPLLSFFVLFFLFTSSLFASEIVYSDSWGKQGFSLEQSSGSEVTLNFSIQHFRLENRDFQGKIRTVIQLPEALLPNDEGKPNLPGISRYIAIPQDASVRLEITAMRTETMNGLDIAPAPHIPFDTDNAPLIYNDDPTVYSKDAFYPAQPVIVSKRYSIRGVDVILVSVTPFQYNPVKGELKIIRDVKIRLQFDGGNGIFARERLRSRWWEPILHDLVLNYRILPRMDFTSEAPAPSATDSRESVENVEYLIITPNDPTFLAWADSLRRFRNEQGIKTGVVTTDEIGGNTYEAIKSYVDNAYNNWETPPSAILLLADYGNDAMTITSREEPHPYSGTYISDNWYADVTGDTLPDIVFSRITARNEEELRNTVGKILDYERHPPTNAYFYDHPVTAMGWQTERWFQLCSEVINGFWEHKLGKHPVRENAIYSGTPGDVWSTATNTDEVVDYFGPNGLGYIPETPEHLNDWGGNATRLNNDINSGAFMVQHRDHGSETGWGEPDYGISDLSGLDNNDLTFVFSVNCLTGKFNWSDECFAEAFHRHSKRALGLIAATQVSYSFVNDTYTWGMYDNMWPEFMPDKDTWFKTRFILPGFASAAGKYFLKQSDWPYNEDDKPITYNLFHHHGGSFSMVYTEMPQTLTVNHNSVLEAGATTFSVSADSGALIGISKNGEYLGSADATGEYVDIPIPAQDPGDTIMVTVTKQNYYRYSALVPVVSSAGPYVTVESHTIDDTTSGNSNGKVEFDESFFWNVNAKNIGSELAHQVTAVLRTNDTYVTLTDSTHFYGDIDTTQIVAGHDAFALQAINNAPDQHSVACTVTFSDTSGNEWKSNLSFKIQAPALGIDTLAIDDSQQGDGDQKLDPGETALFYIGTFNEGHATAQNTLGHLKSLTSGVTVNTADDTLGTIAAGDTVRAEFSVTAASDVALGSSAFFEYTVHSGAYSAIDTFEVIIGQVPSYNMSNSTVTVSNAIFYDSGGEDNDYSSRERLTMTFKPEAGYSGLKMHFTDFDVMDGDELHVYDGPSTSSPEIAGSPFSGTDLPPDFETTNSEGALTFYFISNFFKNSAGWRAEISPQIVAAVEQNGQQPGSFVVYANYPNPFNPTTTLRFDLPQATSVEVTIFDINGKRIRTLHKGTLAAGSHRLRWDGKNAQGQPVTSGVYFYSVKTDRQRIIRKMILLK